MRSSSRPQLSNLLLNLLLILSFLIMSIHCTDSYNGEDSNYADVHEAAQAFYKKTGEKPSSQQAKDDLYYFFTLYDYNQDGYLDGYELLLASGGYELPTDERPKLSLQELEKRVEHALLEDDKNNDGKISWEEYLESQAYHNKLD